MLAEVAICFCSREAQLLLSLHPENWLKDHTRCWQKKILSLIALTHFIDVGMEVWFLDRSQINVFCQQMPTKFTIFFHNFVPFCYFCVEAIDVQ